MPGQDLEPPDRRGRGAWPDAGDDVAHLGEGDATWLAGRADRGVESHGREPRIRSSRVSQPCWDDARRRRPARAMLVRIIQHQPNCPFRKLTKKPSPCVRHDSNCRELEPPTSSGRFTSCEALRDRSVAPRTVCQLAR
jgi:hypothetical protein